MWKNWDIPFRIRWPWDFIYMGGFEAATAKDADGNISLTDSPSYDNFIYKSTDNMMIQMLKQKDAGYASANGDIQLFQRYYHTASVHHRGACQRAPSPPSKYPVILPTSWMPASVFLPVDSTAGATWMGTNAPLSDISRRSFLWILRPKSWWYPSLIRASPDDLPRATPSVYLIRRIPRRSWLPGSLPNTCSPMKYRSLIPKRKVMFPVTSKAQDSPAYQDYLPGAVKTMPCTMMKIKASRLLLDHVDDTFVTLYSIGSASCAAHQASLWKRSPRPSAAKKKTRLLSTIFMMMWHPLPLNWKQPLPLQAADPARCRLQRYLYCPVSQAHGTDLPTLSGRQWKLRKT